MHIRRHKLDNRLNISNSLGNADNTNQSVVTKPI